MLTLKQRRLVELINSRKELQLPTSQRDLAEHMGITRESLNRLLARTRRRLAVEGESLQLPSIDRPRSVVATTIGLDDEN
jgi:predicted DNA-binding protein (UPF0251 family)